MRPFLVASLVKARRFGGAQGAAAAVEMAFMAPLLVFMMAGMIDFGTGAYAKMVVTDAAQAGAAYAQLNANTQWSSGTTYAIGDTAYAGTQLYHSLTAGNTGNNPVTSTTNWSAGPCASNTGCTWNTRTQTAATSAHTRGTPFSTAPAATAGVYYCCISSGTVNTGDTTNCTQPPAAAPSSCSATYGTYTQISVSSTLTTLLPYNYLSAMFNFQIPSSFTLRSTYLVRIE